MTFPVAGVDAKLAEADNRLRHLIYEIERGSVTELLETRTDRDPKGRVRIRVKQLTEVPDEWHVWIGECVHDMRSALNHIAYALNAVGSGTDPPPNARTSQFPLYSRRNDFRGMARRRPDRSMIGYFPRGARTLIESFQPYHQRGGYIAMWLGVLSQLSNIDKHRRFPLAAVMPMLVQFPAAVEGHRVADTQIEFPASQTGHHNRVARSANPAAEC